MVPRTMVTVTATATTRASVATTSSTVTSRDGRGARRARTRRVRAVSKTASVASRRDGGGHQAIVRVRRRYFRSTGVAHRVFAVLSTRKFRIDVVAQTFVRRVRRRHFRSTGVAHRVFAVLSTSKFRIDVVARADASHRIRRSRIRRSSPSGDGHRIRIGFRVGNHLSIPFIHVQRSTWKNM